ncbi:MAG: tRNA-dihydrouridine synthase family protein, partial [Desulfobacula sp.]|nr:tRNA-dihydrouridine synthase family protein [Desulfobacula sp.]
LRLGRKSKNEIFKLLPVFDKYPLDEIIIHPRTGIQMYEGSSDHDAFEKAILHTCHKVVYNGDIMDKKSYFIVREKFPNIQRFMIGRGLLSNPFLAETIKNTGANKDHLDRLKNFHDDLFESYKKIFDGPGHLIGRMKGFWNYLGPGCFNKYKKPLKNILKSNSIVRYEEMVEKIFLNSKNVR